MKTKKILSFAVLMAAMTGMTGITFDQAYAAPGKGGNSGVGGVGPDGYKLQLIGIDKDDDQFSNDETNNSKNIFVKLWGNTRILLSPGEFNVIDWDGTDGVAAFQLPDPGECDVDNTNSTAFEDCDLVYGVYMRVLGSPHLAEGYSMTTCATELEDQNNNTTTEEVCSVESVDLDSANGKGKKSKWTNVSQELLTMCIDTDVTDGTDSCDLRVELFDDRFVEFLWDTNANGHKLAQLLFKPIEVPT